MKILSGIVVAAAVAAAVCGCASNCGCAAKAPRAKHVVLVGVDGLGARWIPWDKMPNLRKLRAGGLYAVGRDSFPTSSGINWATCMMGTVVEVHGYRNWNSKKPDVPAFEVTEKGIPPCIFHEIKRQNPSAYTASLYNWDGIGFVHATNEVDYVRYFGSGTLEQKDDAALAAGLEQLKKHKPVFTFIYQHLPDCYGHSKGWGSPEYTNACVHVDANVGRLVKELEECGLIKDTVVMLVADHGGEGKKHGMACLNCFEIPFLVYGPAVDPSATRLREPVLLADAAPTIAEILGYKVPEAWRGRVAVVPR